MVDEEIALVDGRRRDSARRHRAVGVIFRVVIDAEIGCGLVLHVRTVREKPDLVEFKPAIDQIFDLLVVDARRVRGDAGVEEFDLVGPRLSGRLQKAGKRVLVTHADTFGEGIADDKDAARGRPQRYLAYGAIL